MDNRIGTCSECDGPVVMPNLMVNPVPRCERCGAIAKHPHGPVIPMQPPNGGRYATDEEARASGERMFEKHRELLKRLSNQ